MHSKSDSLEPMIYDKAGELIQEVIFESILSSKYKTRLEESIKIVILLLVVLFCCITNVKKINYIYRESYIDSPD